MRLAAPSRLLAAALGPLLLLGGCDAAREAIAPIVAPKPKVEDGRDARAIGLGRIEADMPDDAPVVNFPNTPATPGHLCNYHRLDADGWMTAGEVADLDLDSSGFAAAFAERLEAEGYRFADDARSGGREPVSPDLVASARVVAMQGEFCREHHAWDGRPTDSYGGRLEMEIEWSVADAATGDVALTAAYPGRARQARPVRDGLARAIEAAFADSASRLAASEAMVALAAHGVRAAPPPEPVVEAPPPARVAENGPGGKAFESARAAPNVAAIEGGGGQGAAFFIGREGLALTAAHLVGAAETATLRLASGVAVPATVLAVDAVRDVALLKAEIVLGAALPIDRRGVRKHERVHTVAAKAADGKPPKSASGVVRTVRADTATGLAVIQASTSVSPGGVGGPLFDKSGAVVGLALAASESPTRATRFAPIGDVLDRLEVELK